MTRFFCDAFDTPAGLCFVALAEERGAAPLLTTLSLGAPSYERALEGHVRDLGEVPLRDPHACADLRDNVDGYFMGDLSGFNINIDSRGMSSFTLRVLNEIRQVPYGVTDSYGAIAAAAERPGAARAVGTICRRTRISLVVPVHRIVRADGTHTAFGTQPTLRDELLHHERVHRQFLA